MRFFKRRITTSLVLATSFAAISACSNSVPSCGDKKTTDVAIAITKRELTKQIGAATVQSIQFRVTDIRTTNKNEKTGAYKCAASMEFAGQVKTDTVPIWYTVEATDSGDFYVNLSEEPI